MEQENQLKGEVIQLTPFESQVTELEDLVKDYKNLIVTEENYNEMNEKRLVLYRKRIAIQRDEKFNNDALNKAKKLNSQKADTLIGIISPPEKDLEYKLKAIDNAKELAKAKEEARVMGHKNIINQFGQKLIDVMKITDINVLREKKKICEDWFANYKAEEFEEELTGVVNSYKDTIDGLIKIIESKPKPEIKYDATDEITILTTPPEPYVSNIPKDARDLANSNNHLNVRPAFGSPSERVVLPSNPEPIPEPTFEERAKSGEFAVGVAYNFKHGGYKFSLDPKLGEENLGKIKSFLIGFIDSINSEEEAF